MLFFTDTETTEIYTYRTTLSLHDALPISERHGDHAEKQNHPPRRIENACEPPPFRIDAIVRHEAQGGGAKAHWRENAQNDDPDPDVSENAVFEYAHPASQKNLAQKHDGRPGDAVAHKHPRARYAQLGRTACREG